VWEQTQQALNNSMTKVITGIANLLPGLVALTVALVISAFLAWVLGYVLRRSLQGIDFDEKIARSEFSGLSNWSPANSPTRLATRALRWIIMLIGLLIGVSTFDAALTSQFVARLFGYLPNVLAAGVLLVVGNIFARFLQRSVLIGAVNMNLNYARLLSVGVKWLVIVLTATMVLDHLGIGGGIVNVAFAILFGGIVLALALAVGLGSKDLVSRSLERQVDKRQEETEGQFRHS
jgi:hypothetical protein